MPRSKLSFDGMTAPGGHTRMCEHPGCVGAGDYRAPRSRETLDSYYWFCLEHVRAYNAAWNYYAGMSETEIETHLRRDTVWDRPTWPLGSRQSDRFHGKNHHPRFHDPLNIFGEPGEGGAERPNARKRPLSPEEQAMALLEIEAPFTLLALKTRWKDLAKRHHPDANGGDKAAEERLKAINQAYSTLKTSYFS
jgi:hypothetical protein